jgi:hypothetical protein
MNVLFKLMDIHTSQCKSELWQETTIFILKSVVILQFFNIKTKGNATSF